jgi:hypothetical protein
VLFAVVVSGLQLAVVLKIAGPSEPRDTFALRRPSWSLPRVALVGVLTVIGMMALLAILPFLQQGESEGNGAPFDPDRALPYALNALVLEQSRQSSRNSCFAAWASSCSSTTATAPQSC